MKKRIGMVLLALLASLPIGAGLDYYIRSVAGDLLRKEVESAKEDLKRDISNNVQDALHKSLKDKKTQEELSKVVRKSVAKEFDENGHKYMKKMLMEMYRK